jgi:ribosome-binding protein aMBF1 (putative translation factor)
MNENRKKLDALVAEDESGDFVEWVNFRRENKAWLHKSGAIASAILHALDALHITKKELAQRMDVSPQQVTKILQGSENLTLQTITKIEAALDIELVPVNRAATVLKAIDKRNKKNKPKPTKS